MKVCSLLCRYPLGRSLLPPYSEMYRKVKVKLKVRAGTDVILNLGIRDAGWSKTPLDRLSPGKEPRHPLCSGRNRPQGWSGRVWRNENAFFYPPPPPAF